MIPFESLAMIALAALLGGAVVVIYSMLRRHDSIVSAELDAGNYQDALDHLAEDAERDEVFAAAVAAKHLLELDRARELLLGILRDDPRDGEALLEIGLVAAYDGRAEDAETAFGPVVASRSDLLETLTLHRSWLALERGDTATALRLFSEIEAPLHSKLTTDIGVGDPAFAEWFAQAGALWRARGEIGLANWALGAARQAAPESRLVERLIG